jgi:hypothetical protein
MSVLAPIPFSLFCFYIDFLPVCVLFSFGLIAAAAADIFYSSKGPC